MISDKDEFLIRLGGRAEVKKVLNRLCKERELLRIKIEEIVNESILAENEPMSNRELSKLHVRNQSAGLHEVVFDSNCEKSPYGMHGKGNASILTNCVWCSKPLDE